MLFCASITHVCDAIHVCQNTQMILKHSDSAPNIAEGAFLPYIRHTTVLIAFKVSFCINLLFFFVRKRNELKLQWLVCNSFCVMYYTNC